jgi:hypothetical protein
MRVNQSWQQGAIAKINDRRAGWVFHSCANLDDAIAIYQYFSGRHNAPAVDIE